MDCPTSKKNYLSAVEMALWYQVGVKTSLLGEETTIWAGLSDYGVELDLREDWKTYYNKREWLRKY